MYHNMTGSNTLLNMNRIWIFILACGCFGACQNATTGGSSDKVRSAISGYDYIHHVQTNNRKVQVGEFVYFKMDMYDSNDSLLQSFRLQEPLPSLEILTETDPNRKRNPFIDILSYAAVGDSLSVIVPADSLGGMVPPGITELIYHLVPSEVLSAEEHQQRVADFNAKRLAAMEEMKQRLPGIESLTEQTLAKYKAGTLELQETTNGVQYFVHEKGTGDQAIAQRRATMNYYGRSVSNGQRFDDSFSRGQGYTFRVANDQVIGGWHEIAPYLAEGAKASVFIPSGLGYGERGSPPNIAPNEELYFYMEVAEVLY